jgi:ATP-dependent helicase/nuclease subunit A
VPTPEAEPIQPLAPSKPTDDEPTVRSPFGDDHGARFKRGRLIHTLLQTLPDLTADQRKATAKAFLAEDRHMLSGDEQSDITQETLSIIEHPDFAFLFSSESLAEVPLVAEIDGTVISGQVDRLIVTEQTVAIVDYKTNRPPPLDAKDIAPVYLKQMAAYQAALSRIYPGKEIKGYLLWTDGPTLMPLDIDSLAPYAP